VLIAVDEEDEVEGFGDERTNHVMRSNILKEAMWVICELN
jgi:hypothetical protein